MKLVDCFEDLTLMEDPDADRKLKESCGDRGSHG